MRKATKALIAALAVSGVGIAVALSIILKSQRASQRHDCLRNLVAIDHAINCGVPMSQRLSLGDAVRREDVAGYCFGKLWYRCPSGRDYEIDYHVGKHPSCPKHKDLTQIVEKWVHHPEEGRANGDREKP